VAVSGPDPPATRREVVAPVRVAPSYRSADAATTAPVTVPPR